MVSPKSLFHRPLTVALLGGGTSAERRVSLDSAAAVAAALARRGHRFHPIDPAHVDPLAVDWRQYDVAFVALHGTDGEDGVIQRILENASLPFTGSDAAVSELAFSKSAAKARFRDAGVPTPGWAVVHAGDHASDIRTASEAVGSPLVVKPDRQGSSVGVSIVETPDQLSRALARCFEFDDRGVLEAYVAGTEWTLGMIGDVPLPLVRITSARSFYDYEAKYETDDTTYEFDTPDVPESHRTAVHDAGVAACEALGTLGIARADVRLDDRGQPWVLEVNTLPGFTDHSLVPKAAERAGISFGELCERALASALAGRSRKRVEPETIRPAA